jgi:uncharacterized membrane protein
MDISIVLVVLGAAFLHAFWNFLVRGTHDKALGMAAVMFGHLPLAFIGLFYAGLPPEGAWPYVMASAVLHLGYQVFLFNAYRFGELTQIYPVARGASPLLITLFTMITVPGVLKPMEVIGVIMVSGAIMTYGIVQYRNKAVGITGHCFGGDYGLFYRQLFDCRCSWHALDAKRDQLLWRVDLGQCGFVWAVSGTVSSNGFDAHV